ncbi:MAG: helix-turn-helix domain-containing protein, partial [Candidatus Diapherotrites archaeon]
MPSARKRITAPKTSKNQSPLMRSLNHAYNVNEAFDMKRQGKSLKEIAKKFGVKPETVRTWFQTIKPSLSNSSVAKTEKPPNIQSPDLVSAMEKQKWTQKRERA